MAQAEANGGAIAVRAFRALSDLVCYSTKTLKDMSLNIIRGDSAATIAAAIEAAIQSGKLAGGHRLPAIRDLAKTLKVSPVTVASAYRLLRDRGLAKGSGRRGTVLRAHARSAPATIDRARSTGAHVDLVTGNPDPALLPSLGPALRSIDPDTKLYGGPADSSALVAFAAGEFAADGIAEGPVAITSGSLDAIERLLREHARVGDQIAIEDPTFPALLDLLASLGLVPAPFAIDDEGPRTGSARARVGTTSARCRHFIAGPESNRRCDHGTARIRSPSRPPSPSSRTADRDRRCRDDCRCFARDAHPGPGALGSCEVHVEMAGAGSPRRRDDR